MHKYIMLQLGLISICIALLGSQPLYATDHCRGLKALEKQKVIELSLVKVELEAIGTIIKQDLALSAELFTQLFPGVDPSVTGIAANVEALKQARIQGQIQFQEDQSNDPCFQSHHSYRDLVKNLQSSRDEVIGRKIALLQAFGEELADTQNHDMRATINFFAGLEPGQRKPFEHLHEVYRSIKTHEKNWLQEIARRTETSRQSIEQINKVRGKIEEGLIHNSKATLSCYTTIKSIWQNLVDEGLSIYRMVQSEDHFSLKKSSQFAMSPAIQEKYLALTQVIEKKVDQLQERKRQAFEQNIRSYFKTLEDVSQIRARLLTHLDISLIIQESGADFLDDVFREIIAVPARFFGFVHRRIIEILDDLDNGIVGVWSLSQKLVFFILLLVIPYTARKLTAFIAASLEGYRKELLFSRQKNRKKAYRKAIFFLRLIPYIPWFTYFLVVYVIGYMIKETSYQDVQIVLPIFRYFFIYKMFRLAVLDLAMSIQSIILVEKINTKVLVNRSTKLVGRFFLISFMLLHLTESTVDQGLIYGQLSVLMAVLGLLACAFAAYGWRELVVPLCGKSFPEEMAKRLQKLCSGRLSIIFCLPVFLITLIKITLNFIWEWISEWEISKKYFAKLYRRKIESLGEQTNTQLVPLPDEYAKQFQFEQKLDQHVLVAANQEKLSLIFKEVEGWMTDAEEDQSVVIYGDKGIGKTTILDKIAAKFDQLHIVRASVPAKIADKDALASFISATLGREKGDNLIRMVMEFDKDGDKKKLLLIDDAHNLFLGKVGGFEALKAFINLVNLNTENIFWVLTFNSYSWFYLKGVLGGSNYFRTEIAIEGWSDKGIRDLILNRHQISNYKLSFDQIMVSSGVAQQGFSLEYAEEQFFRLLWEQANGNPRVALYLWLNCLRFSHGSTLKVGLPERPKLQKFNQLDDISWFVLGTVVSHENLTRKEIADSINIEVSEVSHSIKVAVENKLLHRGKSNRYRIGFVYQQDLVRQLKIKNFIYGIT